MESSAELLGRLVAVLLVALPALYFLIRGLMPGPRSRRLANLALFCGLTAFVTPEITLGLSPAERPGMFLASGAARVLLALVGIVLGVAALVIRRHGEVGVARPVIGVGFSVLHLVVGAGLLLFDSFAVPSKPWVYRSPDGAYSLTLPSQRWKQAPTKEGGPVVAFVRPLLPHMQAAVQAVRRQQTEADFARTAQTFRARAESNPKLRGKAKFREGNNTSGHRYHYWTAMDSSPDGKPVYVAYSVTWSPRQQMVIELLFEGLPTMISQAGKAAEMDAIEKAAESICLSVE
jgi:hypothetical protein